MNQEEIHQFWIKSSERDYKTMNHLYKQKDYAWSLFVGHLVLEKLLKATYVKSVDTKVPMIHDLLRIADQAGLQLSRDQRDLLDIVTQFNIRARYDDYKLRFHKICTKTYAEKYIHEIKSFRQWLKKQL
jgi:HEPN domain-containing protein